MRRCYPLPIRIEWKLFDGRWSVIVNVWWFLRGLWHNRRPHFWTSGLSRSVGEYPFWMTSDDEVDDVCVIDGTERTRVSRFVRMVDSDTYLWCGRKLIMIFLLGALYIAVHSKARGFNWRVIVDTKRMMNGSLCPSDEFVLEEIIKLTPK